MRARLYAHVCGQGVTANANLGRLAVIVWLNSQPILSNGWTNYLAIACEAIRHLVLSIF